jgi:predicted 3-demethylubiquinone-9 3-methyltransferase (glyoxalase superfamily)
LPTLQKITTFLMFEGKAEEAMRFYTSLFADSEVLSITRYGPAEAGPEGTVQLASFALAGQPFMCIDSAVSHNFTFTPSMSLYVQCDSDDEIERLYGALREGGQVLMPLDSYDFSAKFGWVNDPFGVSWQLNLAESG